jgi:hypothetical protein
VAHNAIIKKSEIATKTIVDPSHPPVIRTVAIDPDGGALEAGTILMDGANGAVIYNPTVPVPEEDEEAVPAPKPIGVLIRPYDPAQGAIGSVLAHGVVNQAALKGALTLTDSDYKALASVGIYS